MSLRNAAKYHRHCETRQRCVHVNRRTCVESQTAEVPLPSPSALSTCAAHCRPPTAIALSLLAKLVWMHLATREKPGRAPPPSSPEVGGACTLVSRAPCRVHPPAFPRLPYSSTKRPCQLRAKHEQTLRPQQGTTSHFQPHYQTFCQKGGHRRFYRPSRWKGVDASRLPVRGSQCSADEQTSAPNLLANVPTGIRRCQSPNRWRANIAQPPRG
mmetsp:Transcript_25950/g.68054  ORF Transcript_25950/g.68054 Transcript_25950/m.68054 type:complete len:213 (+) Transcript_25950:142-780(+)